MNQLTQLIYVSKAFEPMDANDLTCLLESIRPKNASSEITGMLLYDGGSFLQVLEGELAKVETLFYRIEADLRHHSVVKILERPIIERQFPEWSMGFAEVNEALCGQVEGLNDFYTQATCLLQIDSGRASKILQAFAQGRWH